MRKNKLIAMISAAVAVSTVAMMAPTVAEARCTKLAFSVNDYGKQGPIDDAKKLLDVYIAKWAAERGVKQHTVGKKDVTCELFLDVGLFDEHTCKAAATVCWPGNEDYANRAPIPGADAAVKAAASKPAVKTKTATAAKPAPITTGSISAPATAAKPATPVAAPAPAATPAPTPAAAAAPAAPAAAPTEAPKAQ
jgi:hypothetical protein